MWCPRFAAVGACFGLMVWITIPDNGLAQGVPGYRMRVPTGVSVRPPRLTGATPTILDPAGGQFGRRFVVPYQYLPWDPIGSSDYAYPDDSTDYSMEPESARDSYPVDDSVLAVGRLQVSLEPIVSRTIVRLTWRDHGVGAAQVAFFLADRARAVLSAQTVRSPPFTALFEPPPGTAFAGMTVVLPGGTLVTQFLPYRRRAR
jgi:hypothetical protein